MKTTVWFAPLKLAAIGLSLTSTGIAQYYAPDTAYHDPVQRVFPKEATRSMLPVPVYDNLYFRIAPQG